MKHFGLVLFLMTVLGCTPRSFDSINLTQAELETRFRTMQRSDLPNKDAHLLCLQNALMEVERAREAGQERLDQPLATGCVLIPASIGDDNQVNYFRVQAHFLLGESDVKKIRFSWDKRTLVVPAGELDQRPFHTPNGVGIEGRRDS